MDTLVKIIEILAWPVTTIIVVMMLRAPLSELVPTLKKLKYKDLELEFEKEARKILAEAERDLPEPPPKPESKKDKDSEIRFSLKRLEPAMEIMESWRNLEIKLCEFYGDSTGSKSIGHMVRELAKSEKLSKELANLIMELASLRNRVAHTNEEVISYNVSSSYKDSITRVISALEASNA
tara:strand:+ start:57 stop:596 length:540 start_codon:yes stop_codon:yes gene_type:complete